MTWQRIDEDTYIDDTLVTCAEYQLFIDEMREQGKHYQPDHWTSYQFPAGQSREPILGVRHSDALAFCEWLAKLERHEIFYRLPTRIEADSYSMKYLQIDKIGYWIAEYFQFSWLETNWDDTADFGKASVQLQFIDVAHDRVQALSIGHTLNQILDNIIDHNINIGRIRTRARTRDFFNTITLAFSNYIDRIINRDPDRISSLARYLNKNRENKQIYERDFKDAWNATNTHTVVRAFDHANKIERDLSIALDQLVNRTHPRDHLLNLDHASELVAEFILELNRDLNLDIDDTIKANQDYLRHQVLNTVSSIYTDLVTLRERIAGRSPAFEGIRLVRERTR